MSAFTFGGTNLKKGASGDTVKKIQEALNTHGYSLGVDGIWGDKTDSAIRDFQSKNGLGVDGIYGVNTHNSLFGIAGTNAPSKPQAPDSYSDIDLGKYDSGYQKSDDVLGAEQKKTDAENAVNNYGDFSYANQGNFDEIMNKILNREQFSFDLNGNALYQQYKDKYTQQGKMAMQDTMGQAAAMTGGYGSSYASTAGNQAYQASLENLNDVIPELYQMALDKYNQEGQDLYNQYGMLSDDRNMQYGMWGDKRNQLVAERDYYGNEANNAYAKEYGQWADQRDFDTNQYWNETNFGYGQHRDEVADWENERAFQEAKRQYDENMKFNREQYEYQKAQAGSSGGSGGSGSGGSAGSGSEGDNGTTPTASGVSSKISKKAGSFNTNAALNAYLNGLVADGEITEEQALELYGANKNSEADLKDRKWTKTGKNTINWGWGVDNNDRVIDQYGNTYRLDELVDALVKEGMSKKEAQNFVKKYN